MAKKMKPIRKVITIDLFNWDVIFLSCKYEDINKYSKVGYEFYLETLIQPGAKTLWQTDKREFIVWVMPFKKIDKQIVGLIVHELIHCTWLLQEARGSIFSQDVQEPQCYLVQRLLWDFMTEFK